ncbi:MULTISPECIES: transposase [unclassified Gordonia (in: high G+C Gram-positive bacteria)]|uniref:transposase n=1 Tax=unclassified Gordonia (in: high G+C Gram-positive bacteria) TaxID=2657482 RepID=UPI0022B24F76|nr:MULTISPECIES: transposase [unclassified Gordonia (in: high G+C Gram-positive bacteria)]
MTATVRAGRRQRTDERTTHRNGHRGKTVSTPAGDVQVQIPKLRASSFFPCLIERPGGSTRTARGDHGGLRARRVHPQCR